MLNYSREAFEYSERKKGRLKNYPCQINRTLRKEPDNTMKYRSINLSPLEGSRLIFTFRGKGKEFMRLIEIIARWFAPPSVYTLDQVVVWYEIYGHI